MYMQPNISTETMQLPLASVSDCKVRSVSRFLCARSETAAEIYRQISAVYGEECMNKSKIQRFLRENVTIFVEKFDTFSRKCYDFRKKV